MRGIRRALERRYFVETTKYAALFLCHFYCFFAFSQVHAFELISNNVKYVRKPAKRDIDLYWIRLSFVCHERRLFT